MKRHQRAEEGVARAGEGAAPPQKRYFRQRAHINPLNVADAFEYPLAPGRMRWAAHFPAHFHSAPAAAAAGSAAASGSAAPAAAAAAAEDDARVEVADVGCGFGGLLAGLSPALPRTLMVGLEIRAKVAEYVRLRILAARRSEAPPGGSCHNASVIKTNAMKLLPRFFARAQLSALFFCFPDPHFKRANVRRRIINAALLAEYAYVLREGGRLYTITDVRDLHNWMVANCEAHPAFVRVPDADLAGDPCVPIMRTYTEEGQKVERLQGAKFVAVFRRASRAEAAAKFAALTAGADFWAEPRLDYEHRRAKSRAEYAL